MTTLPYVSERALARVSNPLPVPECCRHCGGPVRLAHHREVYYGRTYGDWPFVYQCRGCGARVGLHPETHIPLGPLASEAERRARMANKPAFEALWRPAKGRRPLFADRRSAYVWLAAQLGIPRAECHWAWFDVETAERAGRICRLAHEGVMEGV